MLIHLIRTPSGQEIAKEYLVFVWLALMTLGRFWDPVTESGTYLMETAEDQPPL